jgi:hypothetical protein
MTKNCPRLIRVLPHFRIILYELGNPGGHELELVMSVGAFSHIKVVIDDHGNTACPSSYMPERVEEILVGKAAVESLFAETRSFPVLLR